MILNIIYIKKSILKKNFFDSYSKIEMPCELIVTQLFLNFIP